MGSINMWEILGPKLLLIICVVLFIVSIKALFSYSFNKSSKGKKEISKSLKLIEKGGAYRQKEFLMSPTEREVYKVLEEKYKDEYYVFAQVRVVDVIEPDQARYHSKSREFLSLFRQVSQWHFDYVLCCKESFRIVGAIELDDPTHERRDRKRRDRILNSVCKDAGLDLKRMWLDYANKTVRFKEGS